jgi:uncharacterized protein YycO
MELGDIVFFKGQSWISKIIQKLTGSPYTHVALAMSSDSILEADRFVNTRVRTIENHEIYCVMRYKNGLTPEQRKIIFEDGMKTIGTKYDYPQVFMWLIRLLFNYKGQGIVNNANRLYCSELVDRLYKKAGIDLVPDRADGDVLPTHLLNSPLLIQVYNTEGGK